MYTTITEFIQDWSYEAALTQKILDALTDASLQQQVTPEGRTLGRLAWHVVTNVPEFLSHFGLAIEMANDSATVPSSAKEIAERFRKNSADAVEAVKQQWTDESLKHVQNAFGRDLPNAVILSLLIKHMIHHRGQMTILMRQAGLKIPGVYGPAREQWREMGMEAPTI